MSMYSNGIDRRKELENCTFVKMVLMIIVVFYHSILFWTGNWFTSSPIREAKPLGILAQWLNTFHIYGFALVSGYLFYYLKQEEGKYQYFKIFVKNKAKRLLVPYAFVAIVWVIPISFLWRDVDITSVVENYVLGMAPDQLWFLLMLFNIFIIVWLLSGILIKHELFSVFIVLILYGIGMIGSILLPNVFQVWTACRYVIFFVVGFKMRQHSSEIFMKIPAVVWVVGSIILFWTWRLLSESDFIVAKVLNLGVSALGNLVGAVMSFVILQKVAMKVPWQNQLFVKCMIRFSMPIYLFHQQIVYLFIFLFNGVVNPYLNATINFVGTLMLSTLLSAILTKFSPTRFLVGEK